MAAAQREAEALLSLDESVDDVDEYLNVLVAAAQREAEAMLVLDESVDDGHVDLHVAEMTWQSVSYILC